VAVRTDLFHRDLDKTPITDFFGSVRNVEISTELLPLADDDDIIIAKQQHCDASSCYGDTKQSPQQQRHKFFYANQMPFSS